MFHLTHHGSNYYINIFKTASVPFTSVFLCEYLKKKLLNDLTAQNETNLFNLLNHESFQNQSLSPLKVQRGKKITELICAIRA